VVVKFLTSLHAQSWWNVYVKKYKPNSPKLNFDNPLVKRLLLIVRSMSEHDSGVHQ
jgi:hypothetical protein